VVDLQRSDQGVELYSIVENYLPDPIRKRRKWEYGYNAEWDMVVISKTGKIGQIYDIQGLRVALPDQPNHVYSRSDDIEEQYWEREELPEALKKVKSSFEWDTMPKDFQRRWTPYIEEEFRRREEGHWFMNNGTPTYITGSNYMYIQWSKIDVGYPDFREANRILWLHWEACKADPRCFGQCYLKIRRSGFSFMSSSEGVNIGSSTRKAHIGILSKTGADAKSMFSSKVVPISVGYPFFFKPLQDGMDRPKTELAYRAPAQKISRRNMKMVAADTMEGLETIIDWRNTADNSYDSEKLKLLLHDESGKWEKPVNIKNNWKVTQTCLRLGRRIVGKCMMGSTCNAQNKGGKQFKELYYDSKVSTRSKNGRTKSGLYSLFIPMEYNYEGFIDKYGMPVFHNPDDPIEGIDGELIYTGVLEFWQNEVDSLKHDSDALNEFYRQNPRTEQHAFRDQSKNSLFNLTKIYEQIDFNDSLIEGQNITRGKFQWENGVKNTRVIWVPDKRGRFIISWVPPKEMQNNVVKRNGLYYPGNEHIGTFGCDSYDISGTVDGRGSNGALHGLTKFHLDDAPQNEFFLEYVARPQTAEIFFEDVLMALWFYGMPILAENNKPRLLYYLKHRSMRPFSMNRPDRRKSQLSKTELELGGVPNSSEDMRQSHASAIEAYVEKYVGVDKDGVFREPGIIGRMPFNRTLNDWAQFNINNRTRHDASISSGLAIMANQKHMYLPEQKQSSIKLNLARYKNTGSRSELI
jgi:hypothetical protein